MANDEKAPIIIKKIKKYEAGHHGGAWKVAYADFVTAMMAFFLLLWLLNVTTDEQKALISSYFAPADTRISQSTSGSGGVMGGMTMAAEGALASNVDPVSENPALPQEGDTALKNGDNAGNMSVEEMADAALKAELDRRDEERFKEAAEKLKQAIESDPELKELAQNLIIDMTPEGLRIQIVDRKGRPMFQLGSATPMPETVRLLKLVARIILGMPNRISIRGHTDSKPYGRGAKYTNWELSADRANASRRILLSSKLETIRIENIMGKADGEHLDKENPYSDRNRRISIILLKESIVAGIHKKKKKDPKANTQDKPRIKAYSRPPKRDLKQREEGIIYFP